ISTALKTVVCCATMTIAVYAVSGALADSGKWIRLLAPLGLASVVFLVTARIVRLSEIRLLLKREAPPEEIDS
ncbi:MAG: hypothetical protein KDA36_03500, partial [Planctomycetaceae bacterium]|nr:hypothetical protein [Planctomycetaceae bacterium]